MDESNLGEVEGGDDTDLGPDDLPENQTWREC